MEKNNNYYNIYILRPITAMKKKNIRNHRYQELIHIAMKKKKQILEIIYQDLIKIEIYLKKKIKSRNLIYKIKKKKTFLHVSGYLRSIILPLKLNDHQLNLIGKLRF